MSARENTQRKETASILAGLTVPAAQFLKTYRWAIRVPPRYDGLQGPEDAIPWIRFLAVASIALVIAMFIYNLFTVQMNAVALFTSGSMRDLQDQVSAVSESASQINADLQAFKLSSHSLVPVLTIAIWMALVIGIAAVSNVRLVHRRMIWKGFERTCYVLSAQTLKSSVAWAAVALGAFALQVVGVPLADIMSTNIGAWAYAVGNLLIAAAVIGWIKWDLKKEHGRWIPLARTTVVLTCFVAILPAGLIQVGSLVSQWMPPRLHFSVSARCDENECFAYVRSKHARRIVLDGYVSVLVESRFRNARTLVLDHGHFNAQIYLSDPDANLGPPNIEPGVDRIVRVKKITLSCPSGLVEGGIFAPIEIGGGDALVHVPGGSRSNERAKIDFDRFEGDIHALFKGAEGGCKAGIIS